MPIPQAAVEWCVKRQGNAGLAMVLAPVYAPVVRRRALAASQLARRERVTRALVAALVVLAAVGVPTAGAASLVDVRAPDDPARRALAAAPGVELTGHGHRGWVGAVASDAGLFALRAAGLSVAVRIPDIAAQDRADRRADAAYAAQGASPLPSGRAGYRRLADYEADLDRLVRKHPRLVAPLSLNPPTLERRTIRGIEITKDVGKRDGKPVMLVLGLHHAREWPSGELSMEFAFDLVHRFGRDDRITGLLKRARVVVVPVVNPDGFHASRESPVDPEDPTTGTVVGIPGNGTTYRRKNCRNTTTRGHTQPPSPCDGNLGVDLNRNYGINWGSNGASTYEEAPDYRGDSPFSEPESEAIRRFVARRPVTMLITNHTFGKLVLRPPGVASMGTVPDEQGLKALGDRMAEATGYASQRSWELYDNSGTTEDWSYGVTAGYGYTFESNSGNFHPPYERAVVNEYYGAGAVAGKGNREAFLRALKEAANPAGHATVHGFAPPGRLLRLRRTVFSQTGPICVNQPTGFFSTPCPATLDPLPFSDELSVTRRVGGDGAVAWHVNPSVSPLALRGGAWQMTCEDVRGRVLERRALALGRGASVRLSLACGAPPCMAPRALRSLSVQGGRVARVRVRLRAGARHLRVRVLRASRGRLVSPARLAVRRRSAFWTPPRDGTYVVEVRARAASGRTDMRRRALVVRGGRARRGPAFARPDGCGELRVARLATPAFARAGRRPRLFLRPAADVRATLRIRRRGRTVFTRRLALRGGRTTRIRLPRVRGRRVVVRVRTVRGTREARRRGRVTLRALGA